MSPSAIFWINVLFGLGVGLVALGFVLLMLGTGLRLRLNQACSLFTFCAAFIGFGSALAHLSHWLSTQGLKEGSASSAPLFWMELTAAGLYFIGPSLLTFAVAYVKTGAQSSATGHNATHWEIQLFRTLAAVGFVVGIAIVPAIFKHRLISHLYLDQSGVLHPRFTSVGYLAMSSTLLFGSLALALFLQSRKSVGSAALTSSTAIWLVGSLTGVLISSPFPIETLTLSISILIAGIVVLNRQIFNPLRTLTERFETTVNERIRDLKEARDKLQRLNEQQYRAAQICRDITQMTDPTEIMHRLVELIHNRLGYHHIYFYEPDNNKQYLVIRAAAGTTARTVIESGHRLEIGGHSLVAQAAAEYRPKIAVEQSEDAKYFKTTALPGARAEIALPLVAGDRLLGVLDLQSIHFGAFSDEDMAVMTSLADHVAVTLDNCRLIQEAQTALSEARETQRRYVRQAWQSTSAAAERVPAYIYTDSGGVTPASLDTVWSPEALQAMASGQTVTSNRNTEPADDLNKAGDIIALPIILRGQVIGALELHHKADKTWQTEDIDVLDDVAERLGLALENARLVQESQQRAAHERLASEVTARMRQTLDVETVLKTATDEIYKALELAELSICLSLEPEAEADDLSAESTIERNLENSAPQTGDADA